MASDARASVAAEALEEKIPGIQRAIGAEGLRGPSWIRIFFHIRDFGTGGSKLSRCQDGAETDTTKDAFHEIRFCYEGLFSFLSG